MIKITLSYLILHVAILNAAATSSIENLLASKSVKNFQQYTSLGKIYNANENNSFDYKMSFTPSKVGLEIDVKTPVTSSSLRLSSNYAVMQSTFTVHDSALKEKVGYDERIALRNTYDEVVFSYYENKEKLKHKGVYYTKNTIDSFSIIPILQVLCNSAESTFTAEFSVQHMGLKVPVAILKKKTSNVLPFFDRYTLSPKLEAFFRSFNEEVFVYSLKVTGWQGFIYNHRHFYVFSAKPPYYYRGHWGGPNEMNLISWADDTLTQP
ncbi:MAG: hypothetical protein ACON35_05245 [Candidatus Marinamargulisbacteria bacterium]